MKRRTIIIVALLSVFVATVAVAATSYQVNKSAKENTDREAATPRLSVTPRRSVTSQAVVETAIVEPVNLKDSIRVTGITSAIREVTFSSEIPGKIQALGPDLGQKVRRGQVLARIDHTTLQAEENRAQAAYELAKLTHQRFNELGEQVVSRQQIDESYSAMTTAQAGLTIAQSNAAKGVIRSNMRGIVTAKYKDKAEYVTPGTPIFHVVDYSTIVVEAQLAETVVAAIRDGAEVSVRIDAIGKDVKGSVKTILPVADSASKTFTVRVEVENADLSILVGMSATLVIETGVLENVIVVPQDTVIESNGERAIFIAKDNTAQKRQVHLGATKENKVVITHGLNQGESLVIVGHRNLEDGQPIRVVK